MMNGTAADQNKKNDISAFTNGGSGTASSAQSAADDIPLTFNQQLPPLPFHNFVQHVVYKNSSELKNYVEKMESMQLEAKKKLLKDHFTRSREQFMRMLALVRWTRERLELLEESKEKSSLIQGQMLSFAKSADMLYFMDDALKSLRFVNKKQKIMVFSCCERIYLIFCFFFVNTHYICLCFLLTLRDPVFDVPTAIDVFTSQTYNRLPLTIMVRIMRVVITA